MNKQVKALVDYPRKEVRLAVREAPVTSRPVSRSHFGPTPKKSPLSFHALTWNPFRNPFVFKSMHGMGGMHYPSRNKTRPAASHSRTNHKETIVANRLDGKVAAITGGNQGIGLAIAQRFAQEGADVAFCYRANKEGAEEAAAGIRKLGRKAVGFQCDVSRVADGQKFIADTLAQFGKIDILVNNAGLERRASFWDATEEDYDAVLNVNLKGVFFITQAFVKHRMQAQSGGKTTGGKIINISSVHEELPFPHFTSYCASKGGVKMLTRNLSIELAQLGITINNIAPGAIETPINTKLLNDPVKLNALLENIPQKRLGKPEDVASMAAFLASSESDYATGTTFFVDGGLTWNYQEQ
jgi:glucose 1-dehydrogenase